MDLGKLPTLIDNAERSHYKVHLDLGFNGSDTEIMFNLSYRDDPEIAKWIGTPDFRRALSLAIDREQLNQAFWLGLGEPGSVVPSEQMPENPGKEYRERWATLDGFRLRTDNGQRLRLQIDVGQTLTPTWPQQAEMITQQWKAIGIAAEGKVFERTMLATRLRNDQHQMMIWANGGTESLFLYPLLALPVDPTTADFGAANAAWYVSNGAAGIKPKDTELLHVYDLMHRAAGEPQEERNKTAQEIWRIIADQVWGIGVVGQSPAYMGVRVVNDRLENVPERICISQHCRTPWSAHPEQWYFR
jgi:peptide/nickel transport system substrate-binding protein